MDAWRLPPLAAAAAAAVAFLAVAAICVVERTRQQKHHEEQEEEQEQDEDAFPEEWRDPITYEPITDPCILVATGQLYCYSTLRRWFAGGNYRCPRSNREVYDAFVCRPPALRAAMQLALDAAGRQLPPEPRPTLADIQGWHPQIASCIRNMQREGMQQCGAAAVAELARQLRRWQDDTAADDVEALEQQAAVRGFVLDDLVWLVRYSADSSLQGAAVAVLACCCLPDELGWLAATAAVPLVAMLYSSSPYAQEWALQLLYKICLSVSSSRPLLWRVGAVQGLLHLLSQGKAAFHRDRAAVALATMAATSDAINTWLQEHAVVPLMRLLLESDDRWEQQDAAFALLALKLEQQHLQQAADSVMAARPGIQGSGATSSSSSSLDPAAGAAAAGGTADRRPSVVNAAVDHLLLTRYRFCSKMFLDGQVEEPDQGLTDVEAAAKASYEAALLQSTVPATDQQQEREQQLQQQAGEEDPPVQHQQAADGLEQLHQLHQQLAAGAAAPGHHYQQEQEQPHQPQEQQGQAPHVDQQPAPQQARRRRRRRQQPQHWMAEHDSDPDGGRAGSSLPLFFVDRSSSGDSSCASSLDGTDALD